MIAVLQRVKRAAVSVDGEVVGACGKGLLVLLGVAKGDSKLYCHSSNRQQLQLTPSRTALRGT